jgi:hypothetical protein
MRHTSGTPSLSAVLERGRATTFNNGEAQATGKTEKKYGESSEDWLAQDEIICFFPD